MKELNFLLCLMKFNPMQRMMGTSSVVTGPSSFLTVASWSVTLVAGSKISLLTTSMIFAFSPVSSVILPTSKSGDGRIGSPRRILPSVDSNRMRRFYDGIMKMKSLLDDCCMQNDPSALYKKTRGKRFRLCYVARGRRGMWFR